MTRRLNGSAVMALRGLDLAPFRPRAPWFGADLQTLRNVLCGAGAALPGSREVLLPLGDGDALVGHYNAAGLPGHDDHDATGKPLVVLIHGLNSKAQQDWVVLAPYLVRAGYHVYALDLLGYGHSPKPPGAHTPLRHVTAIRRIELSTWIEKHMIADRVTTRSSPSPIG